MSKNTKLTLALLVLAVAASAAFLLFYRGGQGGHLARITRDGRLLREIDLSQVGEPFSFVVEGEGGRTNTVLVEPGRIRISQASCPDQICVNQGFIDDGTAPIVCLPNKLIVEIVGEGMALTPQPVKGTRRLTRLALLTAIALTIFMVEAQIPVPIAIPGIKLGLANIVTVYAMFLLGPGDALLILSARVFLGAVFSGQMMTLLYSAGGGLLSWLALVVLSKVLTKDQIWLCSPVAALFHNVGQLLVAAAVLKSWAVLVYLPYLLIAGAAAGAFTGLGAQFLIRRMEKIQK